MTYIKVPFLNPVKYNEVDPAQEAKYLSKHFEKWRFATTIPEWMEQVDYGQMFMTVDTISQQVISDFGFIVAEGPLYIQLINAKGRLFAGGYMEPVLQNEDNLSEWVYEHHMDLSTVEGLTCGVYYLKITAEDFASTKVLISEPLCICETIENSLLLEYKNRSFYGNLFFETGIFPSIRVLGSLRMKTPASKDTIYEDQELNTTLLWSEPFEVLELVIGGAEGIPDYLIRRLNRIFGCSTLLVDGKAYVKNEGAKWEERGVEGYPMRAWVIELREAEQVSSIDFEG